VDWPLLKRLEEQHRQIGPLFLQNYYPLTSYSLLPDQWMAWQFNDPEQGVGMIQVFRREKCDGTERTFPLRALDPAATYEIADIDSERVLRQTGAELMATGLVVAIGERPGASILTYRRLR
jgi:alpha-galactosidase